MIQKLCRRIMRTKTNVCIYWNNFSLCKLSSLVVKCCPQGKGYMWALLGQLLCIWAIVDTLVVKSLRRKGGMLEREEAGRCLGWFGTHVQWSRPCQGWFAGVGGWISRKQGASLGHRFLTEKIWMGALGNPRRSDLPFFFLKIFWTPFKAFIECVTILFLFYVLNFWPHGMWDLSSQARDWTHTRCIGRWSLNHRTAR